MCYLLVIDIPGEVSSWLGLVRGAVEVQEVARVVVRPRSEDDWRGGRQRDDQQVSVLALSGEHRSLGADLAPEPGHHIHDALPDGHLPPAGGDARVDQEDPAAVALCLRSEVSER